MNDERIGKLAEQAKTDLASALPLIDLLREMKDERALLLEMELNGCCAWMLANKKSSFTRTRLAEWAFQIDNLFYLDIHNAADVVRLAQAIVEAGTKTPVRGTDPTPRRRRTSAPPDDRTWEEMRRQGRRLLYAVRMDSQGGESILSEQRFASIEEAGEWIREAHRTPLGRSCMYTTVEVDDDQTQTT